MPIVDLDHANHAGIAFAVVGGELRATAEVTDADLAVVAADLARLEGVAGGAGFVNATGAVALDLATARQFHSTMTGNITSLAFSNIPTATVTSAAWTWVLRINATGGYTLGGLPSVTFVDGRSFSDAVLTADAENIFTFWRVGSITYGALVTNGVIALEPFVFSFAAAGSQLVGLSQAETLVLPAASTDAAGGPGDTPSYAKNGAGASGTVSFASGDRLTVTVTSFEVLSTVSVKRTLG